MRMKCRACSWGIALGLIGMATAAIGEQGKSDVPGRWPAEQARQWYQKQPWLVGCNFLPSTAVNDVEMWQPTTFDAETIDRELAWAEGLGFNTVRVFLNYVMWEADAEGLKRRIGRFLEIADRHRIATMVILFDDCFLPEPRVGRQEEPVPGVHNSQWVQSPGVRRRDDPKTWPQLEKYVKDIVGAFGHDRRVAVWDLYNEPSQSLPLVEATFRWARQMRPDQPLTTCLFGPSPMPERIAELSDVISFHNYGPLAAVKAEVERLKKHGRPLLCTEWMARGGGSRFATHLPFFKEQKIGCWNWGLVAGRTQTYYPWGSKPNSPEPSPWHHDILRRDGSPFSEREARAIRIATGVQPGSPEKLRLVVPTAQKEAIAWRYTTEKPAAEWFRPDFCDSAWQQGAAPFGTREPPIGREPRTTWTCGDIWLRRDFALPAGKLKGLVLLLHHDEDAEVYFSGVLATKVQGFNAEYEEFEIGPAAQAALKPGQNVMAVHCHQTAGGQYIDVGIGATEE